MENIIKNFDGEYAKYIREIDSTDLSSETKMFLKQAVFDYLNSQADVRLRAARNEEAYGVAAGEIGGHGKGSL